MYKKLLFLLAMPFLLSASNVTLTKGEIVAHTKVFGDANINPSTNNIKVQASIEDTIESFKGKFIIKSSDLKSTKPDRDAHMYKTLESEKYPEIVVDIKSVTPIQQQYKLNATVTLHGVTKPLESLVTITQDSHGLSLVGSFSINLSDHGIEPPKLLFLTVRDRIDISYDLLLK